MESHHHSQRKYYFSSHRH